MSPLVPGLMRSATSYLDGYDSSNYTGVIVAADWQDYADDAALVAAFNFANNGGSFPSLEGHRVRKINADPIFPNRMIRYFFPYNDDCAVCAGSSGGRAPALIMDFGGLRSNMWLRYVRRFFGTAHPQGGASANWTAVGTYGSGGPAYKCIFINWTVGYGGRMEHTVENATQSHIGAFIPDVTISWALVTESGFVDWADANMAAQFTGEHVYEHIYHYLRDSDDKVHIRFWQRQLTLNGVWNPQTYQFRGDVGTRTAGAVFPHVRNLQLGVNKNVSNRDDGLTTVTFDDPDSFSSDSGTEGTPRATGVDYKGMRIDYGPFLVIDGTVNADPFGVDYFGRSDPDW